MSNWCVFSVNVEGDCKAFIEWMALNVKKDDGNGGSGWLYRNSDDWAILGHKDHAGWFAQSPDGVTITGAKKWCPPLVEEWAAMFPALEFHAEWTVENVGWEEYELQGDQARCINRILEGDEVTGRVVLVKDRVEVQKPPY